MTPRRLALALGTTLGCSAHHGGGGTGGTGTGGGLPADVPEPVFVDPANGMSNLGVDAFVDLDLEVASISVGLTTLTFDERNFGTLGTDGPDGHLVSDTLSLHPRGAMVPGTHVMQLRTPYAGGTRRSKEITLALVATAPPMLRATLPASPDATATAVVADGIDSGGVLLVVDEGSSPPIATVARAAGHGWDWKHSKAATLPGLARAPGALQAPVSGGIDVGNPDDPADDRLRIVWRVGTGGDRIDLLDRLWTDTADTTPHTVVDLAPDLVGEAEYAELGAPRLVGDTLVVPLWRPADVEVPHPGDRALVVMTLAESPPGPPRLSGIAGADDIDALGPAFDPGALELGGPLSFAARIAGSQPVVVEIDPVSGVLSRRKSSAGFESAQLGGLGSGLTALTGAFGSRITAGSIDGRLWMWRLDDHGVVPPQDVSIDATALGGITGAPPAIAVLAGAPLFVLARGGDQPVAAVPLTADAPAVQSLSALKCDEVALPATARGNTDAALAIACRRDQEVRLGTLDIQPGG